MGHSVVPSSFTSPGWKLLMFDASFIANPYPTYAKLRETAPIHWAPSFGSGAWLLPRFEGVEAALHDPRLSSKRSHRLVSQYHESVQKEFSEFNHSFSNGLFFSTRRFTQSGGS
jgi:cytochrome P450